MVEKKFSFEKLQHFKKDILEYKGYNLYEVLSIELALLISGSEKLKFSTIGKFLLRYNYNNVALNKKIFFTIGRHGRKDYQEIMDHVKTKFSDKENTFFDFNDASFQSNLSLKNIVGSLKNSFSISNLSWRDKLLIASKLCFYRNNIDHLEKIKLTGSLQKAVVFSSVHPWEVMFLYYFRKRNIPVYSLQHGVYFIYKKKPPIDCILYENFNVDFHLCWGKYSKIELVDYGIDKDKLIVAGYPRSIKMQASKKTDPRKCIVLLAREVLKESNYRLIEVLKQFIKKRPEMKFYFKLHPSLDEMEYKNLLKNKNFYLFKKKKTLIEIFTELKYSRAICVYTTAYYEAYINGIIGLRYHDGTSELSEGVQEDTFEDVTGLENVFELGFSENEIKKRLEYIIGLNRDHYFEVLN
ncbi:hypothetical protein [Ascidiimonas aurantiaca]|uniref:hypothetical protein n=1 Tax=Ascidiimonas aurantiaca TaxID=1685432 RepID=UPI0030EDAB11